VEILINIFGGVALMLWGIRMVRTGVMRSFGAELRRMLAMSAGKPVQGFGVGFAVTTVLQSSTATTLILSSFAGRGLIGGAAALAIILGADVGTTIVVQVLSFDLTWLSPMLISGGVIAFLSSEKSKRRSLARAAIGLGLILLALKLIGQASVPLRESEVLSLIVQPLSDELLLAVFLTGLLTWIAHSSVAVVLFVMSLTALQVLNMQLALAMVLGANLGGGIIPVIATLGEKPAGRRVALGNFMMRATGVLAVVAILPWVQPYLAMLSSDPSHMVANFHTAFNVGLALVFLPFVSFAHRLTKRFLPSELASEDPGAPKYLDQSSFDVPAVALSCAARESLSMGDAVRGMLAGSLEVFRGNNPELLREIERKDDVVDQLHEAIKLYLTRLSREELDTTESERNVEVLSFTTNLEHIGDIIDKNLMDLAAKKIKKRASFSTEGFEELEIFHGHILENFDLAMNVFMTGDIEMARRLIQQKVSVRDLERNYAETHYARIGEGRPDSIETSSLHLDVLRDLKRINGHLTSVAYPILDRAGELIESRLKMETEETAERDERSNVEPVRPS
jgi:phosphate:Na+ symporter